MKYLFMIMMLVITGCSPFSKLSEEDIKLGYKRHSQYIVVDYMNCSPIKKSFSKRQLSKLDKFTVENSNQCGITYQGVRILKSRIRAYHEHYSSLFWREDRDSDDMGAPLKFVEGNRENCRIYIGGANQKEATPVDIAMKCRELDQILGVPREP